MQITDFLEVLGISKCRTTLNFFRNKRKILILDLHLKYHILEARTWMEYSPIGSSITGSNGIAVQGSSDACLMPIRLSHCQLVHELLRTCIREISCRRSVPESGQLFSLPNA